MRRLIKKILLILLALLVAIQVPFIYRRYEIGQLASKIADSQVHRANFEDPQFNEYKGIIHAHTNLGGHSTGSFDELIAAANSNDLDFVIMTEHYADEYDTSALTLNGVYGKTLFVGGNEIDTADGDRFLMIPGSADAASLRKVSTNAVLEKLHSENRLALIAYPGKFNSWDSNFDGDEVFSLNTNAKKMNPLTALFDLIWSFPKYPALTLATYFRRPDDNLRKFDEIAARRKVSVTAGTDAHSNIGFHLVGDDAGHKIVSIKFDPYATTFQLVREHVLIPKDKPFTRDNLVEALRAGRYFVGIDVLGDTSGFSFYATNGATMAERYLAGEEAPQSVTFHAAAPSNAHFVLFLNGEKVYESSGTSTIETQAGGSGAYRVEVYHDDLGPPFDNMPWIISNPIYVR